MPTDEHIIMTGLKMQFSWLLAISLCKTVLSAEDSSMDNTLLAFDCSQPGVATTPIDLLEVSACSNVQEPRKPEQVMVQILQSDSRGQTKVTQCQIFKTKTLIRCGMHSHQMILKSPSINNAVQISVEDCLGLLTTSRWEFAPQRYIEVKGINTTTKFTAVDFGALYDDGSCEGVTMTINDIEYKNVFQVSEYTISLYQLKLSVLKNNGYFYF